MKPGNILLDQDFHIKLIDFATCKVFDEELGKKIPKKKSKQKNLEEDSTLNNFTSMSESRNFSFVGTEEYVCPEILNDD